MNCETTETILVRRTFCSDTKPDENWQYKIFRVRFFLLTVVYSSGDFVYHIIGLISLLVIIYITSYCSSVHEDRNYMGRTSGHTNVKVLRYAVQ